jgi:prolyl-tRNA editing enzyme YbaK/EbsC (Cys-tRNA(Pro) deacylase)
VSNEEAGQLPPQAVAVQAALVAAGVRGEVRRLDESARTAAEAAAALGVEVGQIANSLVFVADGAPLLVLTSGRHRVDTAKVAALLGVSNVGRADADFVRTHTGISIGGVSPIGHPTPLRTLVDVALGDYDVIWAAAGHTHAVFPTTFSELVTITGGTPAHVGLVVTKAE